MTKIASRPLFLRLFERGRRDEGEQIILAADALTKQPDRRRGLRRRFPGQLEIAIGRHLAVERDDLRIRRRRIGLYAVMVALHVGKRKAGLQAHRDLHRVDRRMFAWIEHRRLDAAAVRYRIAGLAPAASVGVEVDGLHDRLRVISWRHHQWDTQRKRVGRLLHRRLIFELHQDGFTRRYIGDGVGEDIRPLLFDQRGLVTGGLGLLVDRARGLPLLDLTDDDALADDHLERVDGTVFRQRIDINRLHPFVGIVLENLRDPPAHGRAADGQVIIGAQPRRFGVIAFLAAADQQGACFHLRRGNLAWRKGLRLAADWQTHKKSRNCHHNRGQHFRCPYA